MSNIIRRAISFVHTKLRGIAVNIGLSLFSVIVIFIGIELILRAFNIAPGIEIDEWNEFESVVTGPEFTYYVQTDSLELRDAREFSYESEGHRVLFLGDSQTFGVGVSNNETFTYQTESLLNQSSCSSWTVINSGMSGTGTVRQLERLKEVLEVLEINTVVLFYFPNNDPYESVSEYYAIIP